MRQLFIIDHTGRTDYTDMHRAYHPQAVGTCDQCQALADFWYEPHPHISQTDIKAIEEQLDLEIKEEGIKELFYHPHYERHYCWNCYPEADEQGRSLRKPEPPKYKRGKAKVRNSSLYFPTFAHPATSAWAINCQINPIAVRQHHRLTRHGHIVNNRLRFLHIEQVEHQWTTHFVRDIIREDGSVYTAHSSQDFAEEFIIVGHNVPMRILRSHTLKTGKPFDPTCWTPITCPIVSNAETIYAFDDFDARFPDFLDESNPERVAARRRLELQDGAEVELIDRLNVESLTGDPLFDIEVAEKANLIDRQTFEDADVMSSGRSVFIGEYDAEWTADEEKFGLQGWIRRTVTHPCGEKVNQHNSEKLADWILNLSEGNRAINRYWIDRLNADWQTTVDELRRLNDGLAELAEIGESAPCLANAKPEDDEAEAYDENMDDAEVEASEQGEDNFSFDPDTGKWIDFTDTTSSPLMWHKHPDLDWESDTDAKSETQRLITTYKIGQKVIGLPPNVAKLISQFRNGKVTDSHVRSLAAQHRARLNPDVRHAIYHCLAVNRKRQHGAALAVTVAAAMTELNRRQRLNLPVPSKRYWTDNQPVQDVDWDKLIASASGSVSVIVERLNTTPAVKVEVPERLIKAAQNHSLWERPRRPRTPKPYGAEPRIIKA